jgi:RNA recognition motif-containing protein
MGKKLYVGNLPYSATDTELQTIFAAAGTVTSAKIIMDRETGRSKGFGFVEMGTEAEAAQAITSFNGTDMGGRALTVNEAKPMVPRSGGGGGRDFGGSAPDYGHSNDRRGGDRDRRDRNRERW